MSSTRWLPAPTAIGALVLCVACDAPQKGRPEAMESLPLLVAHEEARLGHAEDPTLGFTRIAGVDVDSNGLVYVGEAAGPEIRVFEPDGSPLRTLGGRGQGPGEFEQPPTFGVRGDTVWAIQSSTGRITLFHASGGVVGTGVIETVQVPLPSGMGFVLPRVVRTDGRLLGFLSRVSYRRDAPATGVDPTDSIPWPLVAFDLSGAVVDTLGWAPKPPPRMWRPPSEEPDMPKMIEVAGRRHMVPQALEPFPSWLPVADGMVIVDTPEPTSAADAVLTVTRVGPSRDTIYHRPLSYEPAPFTDAELDSIAARAARGAPGGFAPYRPDASPPPGWEPLAQRLRAEMDFPPYRPPLDYPWASNDGSAWLRRSGGEATGLATWVVIDIDGRPRGQVRLPWTAQPQWTSGNTVWAAVSDDLDIPWLVRYRLEPGA